MQGLPSKQHHFALEALTESTPSFGIYGILLQL